MKTCFESGITDNFSSLIKFFAELSGKARKDTDKLATSNLSTDDSIKLGVFLKGPLLTLFSLYPIIILVTFCEI